jgi:hypothetical protein
LFLAVVVEVVLLLLLLALHLHPPLYLSLAILNYEVKNTAVQRKCRQLKRK